MNSSCFLSKRLVLVCLGAMQLLVVRSVSSMNLTNEYLFHKCRDPNDKIYGSKSKYLEKLNSEIRHYASSNFLRGYRHESTEDPPNSVTIMFWCRGDSYGSKCRSCFATAIAGLRRRCKIDSVGAIWYDQCFLETAGDKSDINNQYEDPLTFHNPKNINGDIKSFNTKLVAQLNKLTLEAGRLQKDKVPVNYAAGEERFGTSKIYAMVQCVQYDDYEYCKECLESYIKELSKCCDGKQGARVMSKICNLRYELYPFIRTQN